MSVSTSWDFSTQTGMHLDAAERTYSARAVSTSSLFFVRLVHVQYRNHCASQSGA